MPNNPFLEDFRMAPPLRPMEWAELIAPPAPRPARAVKAKIIKGRDLKTDVSDDFLNLLLSGVKEIFDQDTYITGFPMVEKHLGAEHSVGNISVHLKVDKDIEKDFDKWAKLTAKFDELGWGPHLMYPGKDDSIASFTFTVRDNKVALWLYEKTPDDFDDFNTNVCMARYSLANGLEVDPRCLKDLDKGAVTCNKKVDGAKMKWYEDFVMPRLEALTGKKFKMKEKK